MTRLLRRASAAVRYSVWSVAILSALALPVFEKSLLPPTSAVITENISGSNYLSALLAEVVMLLNVFWLMGSGVMLIRLLIMRVRLWSASRSYEAVTAGRVFDLLQRCRDELDYSKPVRLFTTDQRVMPMTWGILRPSILHPRER